MRWFLALLVFWPVGVLCGAEPSGATDGRETSTQILLRVKVLELSRLGLAFSRVQPPTAHANAETQGDAPAAATVSTDPNVSGLAEALRHDGIRDDLLESLRSNGVIRVLAEPTLVAAVGKPVRFHSGGEVLMWKPGPDGQMVQRHEPYGTLIDFMAERTDQDRLSLQLKIKCSEVDHAKSVMVDGKTNPAIRLIALETRFEAKSAETCIFVGPDRKVEDSAGTQVRSLLVMITPEIVEPMAARPAQGSPRR